MQFFLYINAQMPGNMPGIVQAQPASLTERLGSSFTTGFLAR